MKRTAMKLLLTLSLAVSAAWCQVAAEANEGYKTQEGRARVAGTLIRAGRDAEQKPAELIAALKLKPGMTVADIGSGAGYMLPHLSRAVSPGGKVFAEDIFDDFLAKARDTAAKEKLANVEFVKGTDRDARLPAGCCDLALALDAYHHFDYPAEVLASLHRGLKPGGRLAIVDFYKRRGAMGGDPDRALTHIRADRDAVIREIEMAGFRLLSSADHIPNRQYLIVFEKK